MSAGRRAGAHLVGLQKCWERIRKRAGLEDARLHTLRHTFATTGGELGFSPILIAGLRKSKISPPQPPPFPDTS